MKTAALLLAWAATLAAREVNRHSQPAALRWLLLAGALLALAGAAMLLWGPYATGLDPAAHVYPAIVWVVTLWTVVHGGVGIVMQLYCLARSLAGRMDGHHDMDLRNVVLYWHFLVITAVTSFGVLGLFPAVR